MLPIYTNAALTAKSGRRYAKGVSVPVNGMAYASNGRPALQVPGGYISSKAVDVSVFHLSNPGRVALSRKLAVYKTSALKKKTGKRLAKGRCVTPRKWLLGSAGRPVLRVSGGYIAARAAYVSRYYRVKPKTVKPKKKLIVYKGIGLAKKTKQRQRRGRKVAVKSVAYSTKGLQRLVLRKGFITANAKCFF